MQRLHSKTHARPAAASAPAGGRQVRKVPARRRRYACYYAKSF